MEIQSAFNAGVQGFQKATENANQAAQNIATSTLATPEFGIAAGSTSKNENSRIQETSANNQVSQNGVNLTQSVVDLRVAEFQAKASGAVISSADENLGTLLDVRV